MYPMHMGISFSHNNDKLTQDQNTGLHSRSWLERERLSERFIHMHICFAKPYQEIYINI